VSADDDCAEVKRDKIVLYASAQASHATRVVVRPTAYRKKHKEMKKNAKKPTQ
jgi:hypothetical protein